MLPCSGVGYATGSIHWPISWHSSLRNVNINLRAFNSEILPCVQHIWSTYYYKEFGVSFLVAWYSSVLRNCGYPVM